jgi:hypothetical protein
MLVAHEDERFLQNFLEGRPACPMFSDDDLSTF